MSAWMIWLGWWAGVWVGLAGLFAFLGARDRRRTKSERLLDDAECLGERVFVYLARIDSRIFGERIISVRSLLLSLGLSTLFLFATNLIAWHIVTGTASGIIAAARLSFFSDQHAWLIWVLLGSNLILDYLSVCQTRMVLRFIEKSRKTDIAVVMLMGDFLLSMSIGLMTIGVPLFVLGLLNDFPSPSLEISLNKIMESVYFAWWVMPIYLFGDRVHMGILFWTCLVTSSITSIWLWLYFLGWGLGNLTVRFYRLNSWAGYMAPCVRGAAAVGIVGAIAILTLAPFDVFTTPMPRLR